MAIRKYTKKYGIVVCENCAKEFEKENRYILASLRKKRKHFCSLRCSLLFKNKTDKRFFHPENLNRRGRFKTKPLPEFRWYFQRTKSRNLCNLMIEDIRDQWELQNGKCAISGLEIKLHGQHTSNFDMASLDRIDSTLPYQKDNIQFVVLPLNLGKQSASDIDFRNFITKLKTTQ